jgi:pimeloyl-ACP methyl ester carboxylesterase
MTAQKTVATDLHLEVFGEGEPAVFVHGSFGWGLDTFPDQSALADHYRVILVDRRGFGESPPAVEVGWPTDMHDIAALLAAISGAHLVGQSYGAVVCLLAAGLRPDLVRSLVAIEPHAFGVAKDDPAAAAAARALRPIIAQAPVMTALEYYVAFMQARGRSPEDIQQRTARFTAKDWAAVESSRRERDPADAPIPLQVLRQAAFPKVLVRGAWNPERFPGREAIGRAYRAHPEKTIQPCQFPVELVQRYVLSPDTCPTLRTRPREMALTKPAIGAGFSGIPRGPRWRNGSENLQLTSRRSA